jgi:hypothetical protein
MKIRGGGKGVSLGGKEEVVGSERVNRGRF